MMRSISPILDATLGGALRARPSRAPRVEPAALAAAIDDEARLAALRELNLLDTAPDEAIESFTRLAAELLGAPVSLVTLLDADRQFFAGQQGLEGEVAAARQTPLSHSFCQYAVASREPLVVADARREPLVRDNPAVRELGVIAYAGMPLVLSDGHAVGALCAIDSKPRQWSEAELRILEDLAVALEGLLNSRAALIHQGLHDRLTGLPNRELLIAYCDQLLARRDEGEVVAVLCAGIDRFAQINQAFGTDDADGVLEAVGEQLREAVGEADVFGRLRGDVFTTIAPGLSGEAEAIELATRLREALGAAPLLIDGEELSITVTVGIAIGQHGDRGSDLVSEAANAMREAKQGREGLRISQEGWSAQVVDQLRLREALHGALGRGELEVYFQPIVELESGRTGAFEALTRWRHPTLGEVSPAEFIPIAELGGDIVAISEWVLERALERIAAYRASEDELARVTVNISPAHLEQDDFAPTVAAALQRAGLPGEALGIEITEGGLLETGVAQQRNLIALKELGVRIILDDFGTGYSALSYLRRFPIDVLKIDRSFIDTLAEDRLSAALVQAILAMARGADMDVVAEGIETEEQARTLRLLGCRYGQGFLLGRPTPAPALTGRR